MPLAMPENLSDIIEYKNILLKRKWTILLCVCLVLGFTAFRITREIPTYHVAARLLVNYQTVQTIRMPELSESPFEEKEIVRTLLTSRMLAKRIILKLNLQDNPEFNAIESLSLTSYVGKLIPGTVKAAIKRLLSRETELEIIDNKEAIPHYLVEDYVSRITANQIEDSGLVEIKFEGRDVPTITEILSTHIKEFIILELEMKYGASTETQEWINDRLKQAKQMYDQSWLKITKLVEENETLVLGPDVDDNAAIRVMKDLYSKITEIQRRKIQMTEEIRTYKKLLSSGSATEFLPLINESGMVQETILQDYYNLMLETSRLSKEYGPEHPKMRQLKSRMNKLKEAINESAEAVLKKMSFEYEMAVNMEKALLKEFDDRKDSLRELASVYPQFQIESAEVENNLESYRAVLEKVNFAKVLGNLKDTQLMSSIKIIDEPEETLAEGGIHKTRALMSAALIGLFLGVAVSFFLEFVDNVVRNPEDIKRFFKVSFLGPFPKLVTSDDTTPGEQERKFLTIEAPTSMEAEAIRNIRTNLVFSFPDKKNHTLLFSGPSAQIGKSTVMANLAVSLAQMGKRTLAIDGDLRRPSLHQFFGVDNLVGLSDILIGEMKPEDAIRNTIINNLDLIPCGTIPPSPSEFLGSEAMAELVNELKNRYEIVLFDSPPVLSVMDPLVLGQYLDGVALVARSGTTSISSINQSIQKFDDLKIRILGLILTDVMVESYYSHYASYGYGQEEEEENGFSHT